MTVQHSFPVKAPRPVAMRTAFMSPLRPLPTRRFPSTTALAPHSSPPICESRRPLVLERVSEIAEIAAEAGESTSVAPGVLGGQEVPVVSAAGGAAAEAGPEWGAAAQARGGA